MPDVARVLRPFVVYIHSLAEAMPRGLASAIVLTALGALTEGVGLLALVPMLHLIGIDVGQGSVGHVARSAAAVFGWLGLPLNLIPVVALYVGLIASDASIRRWQTVAYCSLQVGFT